MSGVVSLGGAGERHQNGVPLAVWTCFSSEPWCYRSGSRDVCVLILVEPWGGAALKRRNVNKQLRRAEQDVLLPAVVAYLTRPDGCDADELTHSLLEAAVWLMLALDYLYERPTDSALRAVELDALKAGEGSTLVGTGRVTWKLPGGNEDGALVEDLHVVFHLDRRTRRRLPYELEVGGRPVASTRTTLTRLRTRSRRRG